MSMPKQAVITLEGIKKTYVNGKLTVPVLHGIDLSIYEGEFTSIMGPSGSGKSTFMNILGCLDRPTEGSYRLDGQEVAHLSDDELAYVRNKRIGFVFQSFNLLPKLTALDNVALPMVYAGVSKQERKERASQLLTELGLGTRLDHMPAELSGGQRQRVAIARALANDPAIIMADEPTGNLDSKASLDVMHIFTELYEQGRTIILVTHEPDIAEYAGRNVVLRDGLIVEDRQNFHMKGLQGGERHVERRISYGVVLTDCEQDAILADYVRHYHWGGSGDCPCIHRIWGAPTNYRIYFKFR